MISQPANIQVTHHPESTNIVADGSKRWVDFGDVGVHVAAMQFAKRLSPELMGGGLRVLVRNEHKPNTEFDLIVSVEYCYEVRSTFPEKCAIGYEEPDDNTNS